MSVGAVAGGVGGAVGRVFGDGWGLALAFFLYGAVLCFKLDAPRGE
jgi:hypothetical protein